MIVWTGKLMSVQIHICEILYDKKVQYQLYFNQMNAQVDKLSCVLQ